MDGRPFFVLSCAVDPGLLTNVARADCPTAQGRCAQRFVDMPRRTRGRRIPTSFGSFHAGLANKLGKNKTMGRNITSLLFAKLFDNRASGVGE
jgi:hypothetical protein